MLSLIAALALAEPWDAPMTMHGIGGLRIGTPVAALRADGRDRGALSRRGGRLRLLAARRAGRGSR